MAFISELFFIVSKGDFEPRGMQQLLILLCPKVTMCLVTWSSDILCYCEHLYLMSCNSGIVSHAVY